MNDAGLVRRAQHGNRRAFLTLLKRHDARSRHLAYALLLDQRRLDQVMRTAYLKAWREVVRVDPKLDAGNWLFRTVYNACIDELRLERVSDTSGRATYAGPAKAPPTGPRQPMVAVLRSLSPEQRVAVVLVDHEGFSPDAAAHIQGLPLSVLNRRLAAGRAELAALAHRVTDVDDTVSPEAAAETTASTPSGNGAARL